MSHSNKTKLPATNKPANNRPSHTLASRVVNTPKKVEEVTSVEAEDLEGNGTNEVTYQLYKVKA